ncbi:hypothetical protein JYT61_01205 [bacterium AH-315-E10]|nr:hypothetical protein [bacterium AH-315-E10]
MANEDSNIPDWNNSDNWNEFDWEQALKFNDHIVARYFRMLDRFGDLPDADELIASKIGDVNPFDIDEMEFWSGDITDDWKIVSELDEFEEDDASEYDMDPSSVGDSFFYETNPDITRDIITTQFRHILFYSSVGIIFEFKKA